MSKATLTIVQDPHEALYTKSRPVEDAELLEVIRLAANALELLKKTKTGVGLSANQVGDTRRWFVTKTLKIIINPRIASKSEALETAEEGCLSKPGFIKDVERSASIVVTWTNHKGKTINRQLHGMEARIFQHEYDHIEGVNIFGKDA